MLAGCATGRSPEEAAVVLNDAIGPAEYAAVGKVTFVNREAGFVLLGAFEQHPLEAGDRLVVFSDKMAGLETGELRISGERKEYFLVADIVSGAPEIDHGVFLEVQPGSEETQLVDDRRSTGARRNPGRSVFRKR